MLGMPVPIHRRNDSANHERVGFLNEELGIKCRVGKRKTTPSRRLKVAEESKKSKQIRNIKSFCLENINSFCFKK